MITMTGTEKQVKWAQDIINERIGYCDRAVEQWAEHVAKYPDGSCAIDTECYKIIKAAFEKLFASEKLQNAAFVIENRDRLPKASDILAKAESLARKNGTNKIDECKKLCAF